MAKKAKDGEEKSGGKSNKLLYVLAVIGAVGALKGFVLGGGGTPAAAEGGATATTATTAPGPIVTLEPITINIAGGRFLKLGLGLQLPGDAAAGGGHGGAADSDDPTKGYAKALDLTIEVFGGRTFDELVTPEGRKAAKDDLSHRLHEAYHEEVEGVYFTEFVMQ